MFLKYDEAQELKQAFSLTVVSGLGIKQVNHWECSEINPLG